MYPFNDGEDLADGKTIYANIKWALEKAGGKLATPSWVWRSHIKNRIYILKLSGSY